MVEFYGTKRKIFEAAVELFSSRGVEQTSMRELAGAVGVQPSSIYNHFASKQDLLDSMYRYYDKCCLDTWPTTARADRGEHPVSVCNLALCFPEDSGDLLLKILSIAVSQSRIDRGAERIVNQNLIERPKRLLRLALGESARNELDSRDLDAIEELYACACFSGAIRELGSLPMAGEAWKRIALLLAGAARWKTSDPGRDKVIG